jgi:nucleotide-binding universal stress UspA family protein
MFPTKPVIGLDGSRNAEAAAHWLADIVADEGVEVIAAHVLTYSHEFAQDLSPATMTTWRRDLERELRGPWTASLRGRGVHVVCRTVEDDSVLAGLAKLAADQHVDLIVTGASRHGGLADRLAGNVSSALAHRARCPVLVVPPPSVEREL